MARTIMPKGRSSAPIMAKGRSSTPIMAKGRSSASDSLPSTITAHTVFIDTNLDTHLAMMISDEETVLDFKQKIMNEHLHCFPDIGEVKIEALKVKRKACFYHLVNSMLVKSVFDGINRAWFLHVDVVPNQVVPMGERPYLEPGVGNVPNHIAIMDGPSDERDNINHGFDQGDERNVKHYGSKKRKGRFSDYIVKETSELEPAAKRKRTNDNKFESVKDNIVRDLSKEHDSGPSPNILPQNPEEEAPQPEIVAKKKPKNEKKRKESLPSPIEDAMKENDVGISLSGKETSEPEKLFPEDPMKENDAGTSISRREELLIGNSSEDQVKTLDVNLSIKPVEKPVNKKKTKKKKSASRLGEVSALVSKATSVHETSKESDAGISPKETVLSEHVTNFSVTLEKEMIGDQVEEVGQGSVPPAQTHDGPQGMLVADVTEVDGVSPLAMEVDEDGRNKVESEKYVSEKGPQCMLAAETSEVDEVSRLAMEVDEDGGNKVESEKYVSEKALASEGRKTNRVKKGKAASEKVPADHKIKKKSVKARLSKPKSQPNPPKEDLVGLEDIMPSTYLKLEAPKKIKKSRSQKPGLVEPGKDNGVIEAGKDNGVIGSSQIPFDTLEGNVNRKSREHEANIHMEAPIMDGDEVNFKQYFVPTPEHHEVVSPATEPGDKLVQDETPDKKLKANKKMKKVCVFSVDTVADVQKSLSSNEDQGYKVKHQGAATDAIHGPLLKNEQSKPAPQDEQYKPAPQPNVTASVNVGGGMINQRDNAEAPRSKVSRVKRVDPSKSNTSIDAHLVHSFVGGGMINQRDNVESPQSKVSRVKRVDPSKSNTSIDAHLVHSFVGANAKPSKNENSVVPVESRFNTERSVHRDQKTKGCVEFESRANHHPGDVRKASKDQMGEVFNNFNHGKSLLATSNTIFEDSSSSESTQEEGGISNSELSTRSPSDYSSSSELSKGERAGNGSYSGRIMENGSRRADKSQARDMPLEDIFRSSRSYKKAKLTASQSQIEDTESQPIEFVLDSQF